MAAERTRRRMYLVMLMRSVGRRRSRVLVAVLAIAMGAMTLTGLVGILSGIPQEMGRELRTSGANLVVLPQHSGSIGESTVAAIDRLVPQQSLIGRAAFRHETLRINEQPYTAAGTDLTALKAVRPYWQVSGAWPGPDEVLIGRDVATTTGLGPGSTVRMIMGKDRTVSARVAGVIDAGDDEDGFVFMSPSTLTRLSGTQAGSDVVEYSVDEDADTLGTLATTIDHAGLGVTASPVKRLQHSETAVLRTLGALLLTVTVVVLVLAMITVATTMTAMVTERRTEIGLKKALGAAGRSIMGDFLGEGVLLGLAGGLLGGVLGLGFAELVSAHVFGRGTPLHWWLVPAAVAISLVVTTAACLEPVRRVGDIDPAVVLRGE